ncbi:MAG: thioredoxin domain-containing protein [Acidobacteriota bacterium]|nr:thioredoxin domain-containing protein [Acidobacteriota bacterium]
MRKANLLVAMGVLTLMSGLAQAAFAQDINSVLKPPKGSQVALVVFEDLQCPQCRRAAPLVSQAGKTYKIPVVRYDFPLPMHSWSYQATIFAHFFDGHSKQLGNQFRDYIFEHQVEILPDNLRGFADKFAAEHKVDLPFVVDPQGKLSAEVNAERDLGNRVGIHQTPTVYVVSSKPQGKPYVEVTDMSQLFQLIDAVKQQ